MSQWGFQIVLGKLMTDETFRARFTRQRSASVAELRANGVELTRAEAALLATNIRLWSQLAVRVDEQLRAQRRSSLEPLTARQRDVLRGVVKGESNKQIAITLGVSEGSVKATLQQLFRKTSVRTRTQLMRLMLHGSLDGDER